MSNITLFFAAMLGVASWLAPNHYLPWLSFHSEAVMGCAALLAFVGEMSSNRQRHHPLPPLTIATLLLAGVPLLQALAGLIHFAGDAWMVFIYLMAFALAQVLGQVLARRLGIGAFFERIGMLLVAASLVCVGLQLYQWLRLEGLGVFAAELAPGLSPYANVAQANHLATMLFLGVVGVLYLYERQRVRGWIAAMACIFFAFGLVMTGSRTAWLAVGLLTAGVWAVRARANLRVGTPACAGIAVSFVLLLLAWSPLNDVLLLSQGRSFEAQSGAGARPLIWGSMMHAVLQQPWVGYGWNQGLVAQSRIVDEYPAHGYLIQNSHNLILDLVVWNGVLLGVAITALLAWWFWKHLRSTRSAAQAYLLLAVGGVFLHAMLEYPLSYLYFLLPVGLMMGALDSVVPWRRQVSFPRWALGVLAAVSTALTVVVIHEYNKVESNMRILQFEVARIGTGTIESTAPDLMLLTHLREFLRVSRVEAHPGMTPDELARMSRAAARYPYAAGLFSTAVANGLNGHPDVARDMLARMCHLHSAKRCAENLQAWRQLVGSKYPQLSTVALPAGN
jgi:O-antigen ligase